MDERVSKQEQKRRTVSTVPEHGMFGTEAGTRKPYAAELKVRWIAADFTENKELLSTAYQIWTD